MRKVGAENGVIAVKNTDPYDFLGSKPPLGTVDRDGLPTSEVSTAPCSNDGSVKQSQAFMGMFEQVFGKVTFNFSNDQDAQDSNDVTTGRDRAKGYENITGTLEFQMKYFDARWEGAVKGKWYPDRRVYDWNPYFRRYAILFATNPNDQCLSFTEAERVFLLLGVKLENAEIEATQPNKISVPIFVKKMLEFPNWKASEWTPQTLATGLGPADGAYSLSQQPTVPLHTRLKVSFPSVTTWGTLKIIGNNLFGETVIEEVDLNGIDPGVYITKNYFKTVCPNGIKLSGFSGGAVNIDELDTIPNPTIDYTELGTI